FSILEGQSRPRFHSVKDFRIDFDPTAEPEDLWNLHGRAMEQMKAGKSGKGGMNLLDLKIALAGRMMDSCTLCERRCGADRNAGKRGKCNVLEARITSEFMHYGEEPELVPSYTIFFSGCTFECVYCQNYDISQYASVGEHYPASVVVEMIDRRKSARNVNWVGGDPTSNLGFILEVLAHSDARLPQVWNSNMYLTPESMKLLDGIVDVYLTDFKYGNNDCARRLSKAERYWEIITRNHRLARQQSEVMIRHLVLPNHVECCSKPVLNWIASNLENVRVNIMAQYRPMYQAAEYPEIKGPLGTLEFMEARGHALALGLELVECKSSVF
ncbi:MAG: radical SAM protein, partial [Candidatus Thermoplasmatota archaeon]|nr:radical SAM protein [Candidatus Thermoplasmatota archaeon]